MSEWKDATKGLPKDSYILSAGGYCDELKALFDDGYTHLYAIGENYSIYASPLYTKIKYLYARRENTHFPDGFFDMIFLQNELDMPKPECTRIVRNGGTILLRNNGKWESREVKKPEGVRPKEINVVLATLGLFEGAAHTTENMARNLKKYGIKCHLYRRVEDAPNNRPTIVEWEAAHGMKFPADHSVVIELHAFLSNRIDFSWRRLFTHPLYALWLYKTFAEWWGFAPTQVITDPRRILMFIQFSRGRLKPTYETLPYMRHWNEMLEAAAKPNNVLLVRSNEMAEYIQVNRYYLMPHCAQTPRPTPAPETAPLCLGTYGHAAPYKNFERYCELALKLDLPLIMLLSVNHLHDNAIRDTSTYAEYLKARYNGRGKIRIEIDNFTQGAIRKKLKPCTHLLSLQKEVHNVSSSMRFMVAMGKPVISTDTYQAKEAQVIRVKRLEDITIPFLESTRRELTNIDDGTRYLIKFLEMVENNGK